MNLFELQCFISLAHHLSFTKAATCMYITQPAFSRHISAIEDELGVSLFFRNRRDVFLTNAGKEFLAVAEQIVSLYQEGKAKAYKAEKGLIGSITIGALREQFCKLLSETIRHFKESYPNIEVEIRELSISEMIIALHDYKIDIGFTITPGLSAIDDIIWESSMKFEHAVVIPQEHPLANRVQLNIEELRNEGFIFLEPNTYSAINEITLQICNEGLFSPNVVKTASSISGLMTLVECGEGISIVPYHFKEQFHHKVSFVKLSGEFCCVERILAWRKSNSNPCLPLFIRKAINSDTMNIQM